MNSLEQDSDRWFDPIFRRVLQRLAAEMEPARFSLWLGRLRVMSASVERIVIGCPTLFVRDCVVEKFGKRIADLIAEDVPQLLAVDFVVDPDARPPRPSHLRPIVNEAASPADATPNAPAPADRDPPTTKSGGRIMIEDVKRIVATYFACQVSDLESACRRRNLVRARQIAMALSRELTRQTFPQIAYRFGDRDHTTVIYGCGRIRELCATNAAIAADMEKLRRAICG